MSVSNGIENIISDGIGLDRFESYQIRENKISVDRIRARILYQSKRIILNRAKRIRFRRVERRDNIRNR